MNILFCLTVVNQTPFWALVLKIIKVGLLRTFQSLRFTYSLITVCGVCVPGTEPGMKPIGRKGTYSVSLRIS